MGGGIKAISDEKRKGHKDMENLLVVLIYILPFLALLAAVGFVSDKLERRWARRGTESRKSKGRRVA